MTADAAFWDQIAEKYARDPIKALAADEQTLLAHSVESILACDISRAMIEIAEAKLQDVDAPRNIRFEVAPISADHLPADRFDVVLAFNVLHLVPDLDQALAILAERVRPGGLFISKTACLADSSILLLKPLLALMKRAGKSPHVLFFSRKVLQSRFRTNGFEIVESGDFPRRPPRHFVVARRLD